MYIFSGGIRIFRIIRSTVQIYLCVLADANRTFQFLIFRWSPSCTLTDANGIDLIVDCACRNRSSGNLNITTFIAAYYRLRAVATTDSRRRIAMSPCGISTLCCDIPAAYIDFIYASISSAADSSPTITIEAFTAVASGSSLA